jgi:hypothetical protein
MLSRYIVDAVARHHEVTREQTETTRAILREPRPYDRAVFIIVSRK